MASDEVQQTLDRLLGELKSNESERCLLALDELSQLNFSSPAILSQVERLAIHHEDKAVRDRALQSLDTSVHRYVRGNLNKLKRADRLLLIQQIDTWQKEELLSFSVADVIASRYDFDLVAPVLAAKSAPDTENVSSPSAPLPAAVPTGPRPSLTQTLLSEASIKIYLYLGAFFVIASALILAALVEAARLPILAVATLAFGGAALVLRKRLPQPSFALFIVFSFLLPIDANVLEETIGLTEPSLSTYWTLLFLIMAVVWGLSVWFYESRFFSAVAFVALSLAFYRAGSIVNAPLELQIFLGMLASLAGLAGTFALRKWKGSQFSLFVFGLAQLQVLGLLFISIVPVILQEFDAGIANGSWWLVALTWLLAAVFYILSDLLTSFVLFPWMAVAALLPLPWFFLKTFDATEPTYASGFWLWGAVLAIASEAISKATSEKIKPYHWALLAGSAPLFGTALSIALVWDRPALTFTLFALTALVYAVLHLLRPRWYLWTGALLAAICAYFAMFDLSVVAKLQVPVVFQLLAGSILLVVPELFIRSPLSLKTQTRTPTIILGIFLSLFGITLALVDLDHSGRGALVLLVYAVLFTLHGVHGKYEWLGYLAAACESLAVLYALDHFNLDLWLPALTVLAGLYYASGFFLRRVGDLKVWAMVLVNSGLALGALLSLATLFLSEQASGWYILILALFFAVEIFARPLAWFELAVEALLSLALYQILDGFNVARISHFLFGASLIWLGSDLVFHRLIKEKRVYRPIVLFAGYLLVLISAFTLWGDRSPNTAAIYFSLYALFFTGYALLQRDARLGYLATTFLSFAVFKFCDAIHLEKWIFPMILLAVLYYAAGYGLRRTQKPEGWQQTLLYSGLGLGVLTSFAAPFQAGLDASIPIAIAATLFGMEAFALRNAWLALPANLLYLLSYFVILFELHVREPQFYSIGAALLGMLMHDLLTRAGSKTGAFLAGMLSQLVLLGTTYIQMVSTARLSFFFLLFVQSILVLIYGLIQRSRSLVMTPIAFAVIGVMTVVYSALKGLGPVILIGSTGVILLMAGIVAVWMRERITRLGEQLSDWKP